MIEIASKYNPHGIEDKWYKYWEEKGVFKSTPDNREPYTIVIPPPNVTGVLHMGHMLNNTIQDVLIRRKRMQGFNALWVPGTDHASIATEAKVVAMLNEKGIKKNDLTREEFLEYAWQWKEEHGGIILKQLRKLGASCDWSRTKFTMDDDLYESVIDVFIDLYNKGLIYRGVRMVNWDPVALTAISDEEVIYEEQSSKLYYVRYKVEGTDEQWVQIATTRPETIPGDTAVCVNPNDERYKHLQGKKVIIPLVNRVVPIVTDEYIDIEFGTGCLKITPAHDIHDYEIGLKYNLETIDVLNDDGTMSEAAQFCIGEDRFVARDKIVEELEKSGNLIKIEPYVNKIGLSERSNAPIEPKLSTQWFVKMEDLAKPALEAVEKGLVKFYPNKFINTYRYWLENVRDWCISRQLWWGQRIPVYYLPDNSMIVAKNKEEAYNKAVNELGRTDITIDDLKQDEDVLDTWFSSWLWPISVFDGIRNPDNEDVKYYYPTSDLVSAPDILFFWIARMIMSGLEYRNEVPFSNVYITGIVRDKLGRKMSKSLGNSPDPLKLIDEYGADGVRVGMLLTSPAGNDLPFDEQLCEQGRNFANKIWNALRLVKGWKVEDKTQPTASSVAIKWINQKIDLIIENLDNQFAEYRLSEALMSLYKLIWDDFCSWYLEIIKPAYQDTIDSLTYFATINIFERLMQLLHPFMPFLTEEVWHILKDGETSECIALSKMPEPICKNKDLLDKFDLAQEVVTSIRTIRTDKNIPNKESLTLYIKENEDKVDTTFNDVICKLVNLDKIEYTNENVTETFTFVIKSTEYFVSAPSTVNIEEEIQKLKADLDYMKGFLKSVQKKLSNEKFVNNAPEKVVNLERKKQSDAEAKIAVLQEQINNLKAE